MQVKLGKLSEAYPPGTGWHRLAHVDSEQVTRLAETRNMERGAGKTEQKGTKGTKLDKFSSGWTDECG
jgi:hypothetical protein